MLPIKIKNLALTAVAISPLYFVVILFLKMIINTKSDSKSDPQLKSLIIFILILL